MSVSGIDGSFDIHAARGTVRLQVNKLYPSRQHHSDTDTSISAGDGEKEMISRGSYASAPEGHIIAVVDPEVLHCEPLLLHEYCLTNISSLNTHNICLFKTARRVNLLPQRIERSGADVCNG